MLSCTAAAPSLRPLAASGARRHCGQPFLPAGQAAGRRLKLTVTRAEDAGKAAAAEEPSAAPPAAPAAAPEPPKQTFEQYMQAQPDALSPVGNFFMALLLVALCAGSVFFTVGRQFQADLVPLTPEQLASLQ